VEALAESILIFGRPTLGAVVGLAIGWPTQRERHSVYVAAWVLVGYLAGMVAMWPDWGHVIAAAVLLPIAGSIGTFFGWCIGAATMRDREDWWIRTWGFVGFIVLYQLLALLCSALITMADEAP
jgi:hypothetical protein